MDKNMQKKLERLASLLGKMEHRFPASIPLFDDKREKLMEAHARVPLEIVLRLVLTDLEYDALTNCCPIQPQHFFVSCVCDARLSFRVSDEYRDEAVCRNEVTYLELTCQENESRRLVPYIVAEYDPRSIARPRIDDFTPATATFLEGTFSRYPDLNIVGPMLGKIFKYYGLAYVWCQHHAINEEMRKITQELADTYTVDFI